MKSTIFLYAAVACAAAYFVAVQDEASAEPLKNEPGPESAKVSLDLEATLAAAVREGTTDVFTKSLSKVMQMAKEEPRELFRWAYGF